MVDHFGASRTTQCLAEREHLLVCRFVYPFVLVYEDPAEDLEVYCWAAKGSDGYTPIVRKHIQYAVI